MLAVANVSVTNNSALVTYLAGQGEDLECPRSFSSRSPWSAWSGCCADRMSAVLPLPAIIEGVAHAW